jgi:carbon monoxide dehydrogenase subunit G
MIRAEKTIVINRPQQKVFDFASDPANAHKWLKIIKSKQWTSEAPHGVGSTHHVVSHYMGRDMQVTNKFTSWDPPKQYSFKTIDGPVPIEIEEGMKFEPNVNGTKVIWWIQVKTVGIFKLMEGMFKKQAENNAVTDLETLKHLLEAGSE